MMKLSVLPLFLSLFIFSTTATAQKPQEEFRPSGRIIARSFIDFSQGFGTANKESGFDITRAFLGYNYKFTRTLQVQVVIDGASGKDANGNMQIYLRNAFLNWKDHGFNINIGEIGLMQFSIQESYWKHRYVLKSFQDLNSMAPSVDVGVTAQYKFNDYVLADVSLTNGEGYKKITKNNSTRYGVGVSLFPIKNTILRVYGDVYNDGGDMRDAVPEGVTQASFGSQKTLSLFAGYQDELISGGIEYNRIYNKGFIEGKDYFGYSAYSSLKIASQWRIYARYDLTDSKIPSFFSSPWNKSDGQLMITGVEYQPFKQLKISPNFRNINPDRSKSKQYFFVNLEFNL